jgi:hypothetical protein
MRLEHIPLILGVLIGLAGLAIVLDAVVPDGTLLAAERRRRARPPRSTRAELAFGIGTLLLAAALIGRDTWRWTTVAVLGALIAIVVGLALDRRYVRGLALGPALGRELQRRATDREVEQAPPALADTPPRDPPLPQSRPPRPSEERLRIR